MKKTKYIQIYPFGLLAVIIVSTMIACSFSANTPNTTSDNQTVLEQVQLPSPIPQNPAPTRNLSEAPQVVDEQQLLVYLYKRINPAVVNVSIYVRGNNTLVPYSQGSGFIIDSNGDIATNAHVILDADQIEVGFSDGSAAIAQIVGQDLNSDIAVIKVDKVPSDVMPLIFGDMENVEVGQTVIAIGNPFHLEGTMTRGIISAMGRSIPALNLFSIPEAIQTDAPINPGNSGGPLLNLQGEVIGINAQIETDGTNRANSGVGFAIPVSIIKKVVPELIKNGAYIWPWLGVRGSSLDPLTAQAMNLSVNKGAYMDEIISGGPSEKAGLQGSNNLVTVSGRQVSVGGDVVTAINGSPVNTFNDLLIYVALNTSPGQEVTLTVIRDNQPMEVKVMLEPRPSRLDSTNQP